MISSSHLKTKFKVSPEFIREKLSFVPQLPGVYLHKGEKGEILYVGKAKNLNLRLKSYFTSFERHSLKTRALVEKIYDFEIIVTENEYESLLLENNLIKHNQPPYNILLRDNKTFPYIKLDKNEVWPRIVMTRRKKNDGALYFGPYTLSSQMQQVIQLINRYFMLVKCTPTVFKSVTRPCNYYNIKKCLAPCVFKIEKEEYFNQVDSVINILNGKTKEVVARVKAEMLLNSSQMNYEKAAHLRDIIAALTSLHSAQTVTLDSNIEFDVIASYWNENLTCFYIAQVREGKLLGGIPYVIRQTVEEPEFSDNEAHMQHIQLERERIYTSFITQYYQDKYLPQFIYASKCADVFKEETLLLINEYLNKCSEKQIKKNNSLSQVFFVDLKKVTKTNNKLISKDVYDISVLAERNAENKFNEQLKIDDSSHLMLEALKNFLNLDCIPLRIECFDISTFQGSDTVASQVVFKNGKSLKSEYRKYIIKDLPGNTDDFSSLREVIRRRFKSENEKKYMNFPDLLLIDGGTPQVREVCWILKSLGINHIFVVGIAKSRGLSHFSTNVIENSSERLVIPKRNEFNELQPDLEPETKPLKQGNPEFLLVTKIRDEAHRFAITFHRQRRNKSSMKSVLNDIDGLGPKRKKILIENYPNVKDILKEELLSVSKKTGIPINVIQKIKSKIEI